MKIFIALFFIPLFLFAHGISREEFDCLKADVDQMQLEEFSEIVMGRSPKKKILAQAEMITYGDKFNNILKKKENRQITYHQYCKMKQDIIEATVVKILKISKKP